jgi:hypothetical protein
MTTATHLAQLQSAFQSYLIDSEKGVAFTACVVDDPKVGAKKRLNIYFDAYRYRIIEALAAAYPKLKLLVGDDLFEQIARTYIADHPSTYQNIRWYGSHMRSHLLGFLPEHPIAAEMAAFEWAISLAFDAEDVPELKLQDLVEVPPQDWVGLSFTFQPAIQVIRLRWNVIPIWNALNMEETPPALKQDSCYTSWLIWRKDLNPQFRSLSEMEVIALNMAKSAATFAEVCTSLEGEVSGEKAMATAAQFLAGWLEEGMISKSIVANA